MLAQNMTTEVQDMPPPNILLWYIDYFELQVLKKQQIQGKAFSDFPLLAQRQIL